MSSPNTLPSPIPAPTPLTATLSPHGDNLSLINYPLSLEHEHFHARIRITHTFALSKFEGRSVPQASFHGKFAELPLELRLLVWEYVARSESRVVEFFFAEKGRLVSKTGAPAIMFVCVESRRVGLSEYARIEFLEAGEGMGDVFVAWERDLVMFRAGALARFLGLVDKDQRKGLNAVVQDTDSAATKSGKRTVHQLINRNCTTFAVSPHDIAKIQTSILGRHLKALQHLVVVTRIERAMRLGEESEGKLLLGSRELVSVLSDAKRTQLAAVMAPPRAVGQVTVCVATRTGHRLMEEEEKDERVRREAEMRVFLDSLRASEEGRKRECLERRRRDEERVAEDEVVALRLQLDFERRNTDLD